MLITSTIVVALISFYFVRRKKGTKNEPWKTPNTDFPEEWKQILSNHVAFYNALGNEQKTLFEYKTHEFLLNCAIIGVDTSVDTTDRLLVASSAIIPIFNFPEWRYPNIQEVILYPCSFSKDFERTGEGRNVLGMVGTGYLEGKMILSKKALHLGFVNETDKHNTAIHEFVHLIDKLDGKVDGIPEVLLCRQYTIPWIDLMNKKMDEIYRNDSDINPYGGTNQAEFFSVVSEYFFERPKLLAKKHPALYRKMELIFKQDMDAMNLRLPSETQVGRNAPCPCNSGKKFKKCCGKN